MNLGMAIKIIREEKGFKQGDFAKMIGLSQKHLSRIENNHDDPSKKMLALISKQLNVAIPFIYFFALEKEDLIEERQSAYAAIRPQLMEIYKKLI